MQSKQALVLSVLVFGGCAEDGGNSTGGSECVGGKCDAAQDGADGERTSACALLDRSTDDGSRPLDEILAGPDAFSRMLAGSETCDVSVAGLVEALKARGCGEEDDSALGGHSTVFVSERSQRGGDWVDFRGITSLSCDEGRVFLHYPIIREAVDAVGVRGYLSEHATPAVIAEHEDSGVLNYYQTVPRPTDDGKVLDGVMFFGSSLDMLEGTDLDRMDEILEHGEESEVPGTFGVARNCAGCHPGGGLLMKELDAPWVHWDSPAFFGSSSFELLDGNDDLLGFDPGDPGSAMEETVLDTNARVNKSRAEALVAQVEAGELGIGDLLRPAFCTDEFNVGSGVAEFDFETEEEVMNVSMAPMIVDNGWDFDLVTFEPTIENSDDGFFALPPGVLPEIFRERGTTIGPDPIDCANEDADFEHESKTCCADGSWVDASAECSDRGGEGDSGWRETVAGLTFIQRAHIDHGYLEQLAIALEGGIENPDGNTVPQVDSKVMDVAQAIRSVDLTRSVYSDERCALVAIANKVDGKAVLAADDPGAALSEGLLEAIGEPRSGPESDLAAALRGQLDPFAHVSEFYRQCAARRSESEDSAASFAADLVEYIAQVQKRADSREGREFDDPSFLQLRFPGVRDFMMPTDPQPFRNGTRFDPKTCQLTTDYVTLAE